MTVYITKRLFSLVLFLGLAISVVETTVDRLLSPCAWWMRALDIGCGLMLLFFLVLLWDAWNALVDSFEREVLEDEVPE